MKFENNIILMIVVAVAIYAIFLFISDYQKISDAVIDFRIEYLIPILSLVTASWIPLILMWHLLLKKNGISIPFRKNILIWLSGSALNATPGQLGGLIKSQLIKTLYDIPRTKTAPVVLVEKFYALTGGIIAGIIGIIILGMDFNLVLFGGGKLSNKERKIISDLKIDHKNIIQIDGDDKKLKQQFIPTIKKPKRINKSQPPNNT